MILNKIICVTLLANTLAISSHHEAKACSFGPLDKIKVGSTLNQVFAAIYNSCGGEVKVNRECGNDGCDKSEQQVGKQFSLCSDGGRYSQKMHINSQLGCCKNQITQTPFAVYHPGIVSTITPHSSSPVAWRFTNLQPMSSGTTTSAGRAKKLFGRWSENGWECLNQRAWRSYKSNYWVVGDA